MRYVPMNGFRRVLEAVRRRTAPATLTAGLALAVAACSAPERDTALIVHSPLPLEVLDGVEARFEADFETVDVQMVSASPEATLEALRSGEPVDVWWGAPAGLMEQAADEGLLEPYRPPWLGQPGVGQPDPEGRWQVTQITPFVIALNRERTPLAEAPADWIDLFHHGWTDEVVVLDPERSPQGAELVSAMMVDGLRTEGDVLPGLDWLLRLDASVGRYVDDAQEAIRMLAAGEASLAVLPRADVEAARHGDAPWIHYRLPESGTPMLARGVAVASGSTSTELARVFVDLTGIVEIGTLARLHTRWLPGHGDVDLSALPADFEIDMPWRPLQLAPDTIAREQAGWIERWSLEVRDRG